MEVDDAALRHICWFLKHREYDSNPERMEKALDGVEDSGTTKNILAYHVGEHEAVKELIGLLENYDVPVEEYAQAFAANDPEAMDYVEALEEDC